MVRYNMITAYPIDTPVSCGRYFGRKLISLSHNPFWRTFRCPPLFLFSLTYRLQAKMGVNTTPMPAKSPVSFVLIDNSHLNEQGVSYFCPLSKEFILITSNSKHPAFQIKADNLHIIFQKELSLGDALRTLKSDYGRERLTVQTGGTLNALFLREKLFDYIDIVVAPVLIGGRDTSTLIDGSSLLSENELSHLGVLKLQECAVLEASYLRLRYKVIG